MPPGIPERYGNSQDQATVKDQSSLPYLKHLERILTIEIKVDQNEQGSRPDDGRQDRIEEEVRHVFKRNPFSFCIQDGDDQANDKTEGEEETVSINVEAAQSEKNGRHKCKLEVGSLELKVKNLKL